MKLRMFIAVDLEVNETMIALMDELKKGAPGLRFVRPENLHVTMKFLGDIDASRKDDIIVAMRKASAEIEPFDMEIKGCGAFPNTRHIRIVWMGISEGADILESMYQELDYELSVLGFQREKRDFFPHVTIARNKKPSRMDIQDIFEYNEDRVFSTITVDRIVLKESVLKPSGPIYAEIASIDLGK